VPGIDPATARALSHRLAVEQLRSRPPSVAAGVIRGGELVWSDALGALDGRSEGATSTVQAQYRIGSITKTFVAVEVGQTRSSRRCSPAGSCTWIGSSG
jgi:CubicO group peptidase (beta-lactamase class C family)